MPQMGDLTVAVHAFTQSTVAHRPGQLRKASLWAGQRRQGVELSTGAAAERHDQLDQVDHSALVPTLHPREPILSVLDVTIIESRAGLRGLDRV